ncbi:clock-controlled protein 8 [Achaetomium macrosporum]|uniref:Clock-controlled protein 8 n=1 Tax=Achaetomium macrosporum TaxID=79813 RepID=A0AAN7CCI4_9PEZI|nr:clock-controlled protein 8 [Achaetomium macrosporum]
MEHNHMRAAPRAPQERHREDFSGQPASATQQPASPAALAADTSTMQTSPDHGGHEHKQSGDVTTHVTTERSVQLPPFALSFPSEPVTELAPIQPPHDKSDRPSCQTLPPLSSVTGTQAHAALPKPPEPSHPAPLSRPINHWPSLNPFTTYYTPSYLDPVESSPSMSSEQSASRRGASVSLDDPDVRIAAEALGQMRSDYGSSPRDRKASRDQETASPSLQTSRGKQPEPEPLLSLITTSHPLLASTIEGAASVYNTGKNYSPHIKTGAEYVENYLKPVGKAVGNVSRKTGVEGGVRWIFGRRNRKQHSSTDIETGERGSSKRFKSGRDDKGKRSSDPSSPDLYADKDDRRMSISTVDTLPPYDDQRSPAYTEVAEDRVAQMSGSDASGQPWGQRFVVTTSGLGVAMKQESLRSLKYCLRVLRDTNGYVGEVLVKLKSVIDEYDAAAPKDGEDHTMTEGTSHPAPRTAEERSRLIQRMSELRDDIFQVIHRAVQTVSKYAGSALPENARNLVHRQLMSLPGLYQFHYIRESEGRRENTSPEGWARDSAHLALLFAREALQLMTQVGDVLNRTLVSAEEWCETLYKTKDQSGSPSIGGSESLPTAAVDRDTNMSG